MLFPIGFWLWLRCVYIRLTVSLQLTAPTFHVISWVAGSGNFKLFSASSLETQSLLACWIICLQHLGFAMCDALYSNAYVQIESCDSSCRSEPDIRCFTAVMAHSRLKHALAASDPGHQYKYSVVLCELAMFDNRLTWEQIHHQRTSQDITYFATIWSGCPDWFHSCDLCSKVTSWST